LFGEETAGVMKKSNSRAANLKSKIQCIEVLVSKDSVYKSSHNLQWTLSVYSLENAPAKRDLPLTNSEIFHFMVYDWTRTLKQLLDDHQIPYSIIQFFTPENLFPAAPAKIELPYEEHDLLLAARQLERLAGGLPVGTREDLQEHGARLVLSDGNF
jgi:hypothetical protein